jgi:hypothetical protein
MCDTRISELADGSDDDVTVFGLALGTLMTPEAVLKHLMPKGATYERWTWQINKIV